MTVLSPLANGRILAGKGGDAFGAFTAMPGVIFQLPGDFGLELNLLS